MPYCKIDPNGDYSNYPGFSVIAKLNLDNCKPWLNLYKKLADIPCLNDHFKLLPLDSWHMTTINLFTQASLGLNDEQWAAYKPQQQMLLNKLNESTKKQKFTPQITYHTIICSDVIQIVFHMNEIQGDMVDQLAKETGYRSGVPGYWHITLAYQYKKPSEPLLKALQAKVESIVKEALAGKQLNLRPPTVCGFGDMTAFTEWDKLDKSSLTKAKP